MSRLTTAVAGASAAALIAALGPVATASAVASSTSVPTAAVMPAGGPCAGMEKAEQCDAKDEYDFLVHMIPHHGEAVASAKNLARSKRPEVRAFGKRIIAAQSAEIKEMQAWLKKWYPGQSPKADYTAEMPDLTKLEGDALDKTFLVSMIGHHGHAIAMSEFLIAHSLVKHKPVGPFAANIAAAQKKENKMMEQWLKKWYSKKG